MNNSKYYTAAINEIAQVASCVSGEVNQILMDIDQSNTVVMMLESHCNLAQYYFQTQFVNTVHKHNSMSVSAEIVHDDMFFKDINRQELQGRSFKTTLQTLYDNSNYPMAACLVPSYVIGCTDINFICTDMDFTDHLSNMKDESYGARQYALKQRNRTLDEYTFAQSKEGMSLREKSAFDQICALQSKDGLLVTHIAGIQHGADSENPDGMSLLEYLVQDKQVISIHLCEDKTRDHRIDLMAYKQSKWTQTMKENYIVDFAIVLPKIMTTQDRRVFNMWDNIVTENKSPELLLSRKSKRCYNRT